MAVRLWWNSQEEWQLGPGGHWLSLVERSLPTCVTCEAPIFSSDFLPLALTCDMCVEEPVTPTSTLPLLKVLPFKPCHLLMTALTTEHLQYKALRREIFRRLTFKVHSIPWIAQQGVKEPVGLHGGIKVTRPLFGIFKLHLTSAECPTVSSLLLGEAN